MKKSSGDKKTIPFKEGEQVVYPLQGVGEIQSIEEREFKGEQVPYYIIYLEVSDMTVMVPVDKAEELGIRAIVPAKEAKRALKLIGEEFDPVPADWKVRYQMNLDLLKQGSVTDIATVVRTLYHRSRVKELPILERKLFDSALKLLVDEISFSLKKQKDEVEVMIFDRLATEGGGPREVAAEEEEDVEESSQSGDQSQDEDVEEDEDSDE
jgi:CarD family transcriptional regulator